MMNHSTLTRRQWLAMAAQAAGAAALASPSMSAWAVPGDTRFVLVFLRGAYDAANTLIPYSSPYYHDVRKTLAMKAAAGQAAASKDMAWQLSPFAPKDRGKGADGWAVHPALRESLLPMWQAGQLAFVPFAGTPDLSRSHFETQESMERGSAGSADSARTPGGFLGRLVQKVGDERVRPVSFTSSLPTLWQSPGIVVPNMALVEKLAKDSRQLDESRTSLLGQMYSGTRYEGAITEGFDLRREIELDASHKMMGNGMDKINQGAISSKGFSLVASRLGRLMRDKYRLAFVDIGGWDTHVNQGGATGQLATKLKDLGDGLATMRREFGPAWDRTVVMVISEFGRTMAENGSKGTDHGHGTVFWALGGAVKGGQVLGEQLAVDAKNMNEARDYKVLNDYRSVLGGVFKRIYSLDDAALKLIFPGAPAVDLGLVA